MAALTECSWAAIRKRGSQFQARYYRLKPRRGPKRAIVAVAHSLVRNVFCVLSEHKPYQEPNPKSLTEAQRTRKANHLCKQLRDLGYEVTLKTKEDIPA
jgi:hypothetical protein